MPEVSFKDAPPFVALKSTDNIPIESSWHLFTNYVGSDIKQIYSSENHSITSIPVSNITCTSSSFITSQLCSNRF